jgi:hypothetical protein
LTRGERVARERAAGVEARDAVTPLPSGPLVAPMERPATAPLPPGPLTPPAVPTWTPWPLVWISPSMKCMHPQAPLLPITTACEAADPDRSNAPEISAITPMPPGAVPA